MNGEWLRLGVGGVVPISWDLTGKTDGPGELEGWASVYNVLDQQDDIVLPGAFSRTIAHMRQSGRVIPLSKDHDMSTDAVIGSIKSATDTPYGLKIRATFASTPDAQAHRVKAVEKHLTGLSIFGPIVKKSFEMRGGKEVRLLHEVGLMQVALTAYPANMDALLVAAKTAGAGEELDLARWEDDMRAALRITSIPVRRVAIESLMKARYPLIDTAPPATGEKAAVGDDGGTTGGTQDDAAMYALALIGESGPGTSPPGGDANTSLADLEAIASAGATSAELTALEADLRSAS